MIMNNISWSLDSTPNKSLETIEPSFPSHSSDPFTPHTHAITASFSQAQQWNAKWKISSNSRVIPHIPPKFYPLFLSPCLLMGGTSMPRIPFHNISLKTPAIPHIPSKMFSIPHPNRRIRPRPAFGATHFFFPPLNRPKTIITARRSIFAFLSVYSAFSVVPSPHSATFHAKPLQFRTCHPKFSSELLFRAYCFAKQRSGMDICPSPQMSALEFPPKMRYAYGAKKASLILFASQFRKVSESE